MLVLHYTGMQSASAALDRLCDDCSKVSAHYMVDLDGTVYNLVAEENRAWHAGVSYWRGNTNINHRSIGIEIVNKGHEYGYTPFPMVQMETVLGLCKDILSRHKIPARNVVAHSDIAPTRKQDPGELFDWQFLAKNDVGLFPTSPSPFGRGRSEGIATHKNIYPHPNPLPEGEGISGLELYGYDMTSPTDSIIAFQRHFRPNNLSGIWDDECGNLLAGLLSMV